MDVISERMLQTEEERQLYLHDVYYHQIVDAVRSAERYGDDPLEPLISGLHVVIRSLAGMVQAEIDRRNREPAPRVIVREKPWP